MDSSSPSKRALAVLLLRLALPGALAQQAPSAAPAPVPPVVVVANASLPASIDLARHYARARGLPEERIFLLPLPVAESMTRAEYNQWLRDPLLAGLSERGLLRTKSTLLIRAGLRSARAAPMAASFRYLVCLHGVPLRVSDTQPKLTRALQHRIGVGDSRDTASVDSELATLLGAPIDPRAPYPNPDFNQYTTEFPGADGQFPLWTARLDGPDPATVRRCIDDALVAEREGIPGVVYVDLNGITSAADPYFAGDMWMRAAGQRLQREGYDVVLNPGPGLFESSFPLENAGFYLGWYAEHITGAFKAEGFRFLPGAFAYHLHSFSAVTLRAPDQHWTGPLLARGAAASLGCVDEPYLSLTPHLDVFVDRLCQGYSLAESAHYAQPWLSWQNTVVGDPLYRPFGLPLDQQIENMRRASSPNLEWGHLRKVNQLIQQGRFNLGLAYARERVREAGPGGARLLRERLADAYSLNAMTDEALAEYQVLITDAPTPASAFRLAGKAWQTALAARQGGAFDARFLPLLEKWRDHPSANWLRALRKGS